MENLYGLPSRWVFLLQTSLKRQKAKAWGVFFAAAGLLLALDLWVKYWASSHLLGQPGRVFIPGVLGLTFTRNTGAAFGMLGNLTHSQWILAGLKVVIMLGLLWFYHQMPLDKKSWLLRVPLILVFAGGMGNLYDRLVYGYVRDMLEFLFMRFAIFNVADIYVTVGVFFAAGIVLTVYREILEEPKQK